jgi:predicted alpha/beta hydrolase family esterase
MNERKQIVIIRGGETFENTDDFYEYLRTVKIRNSEHQRNWRDWIIWALSEHHDVVAPLMPAKQNADYYAWKIWFERYMSEIVSGDTVTIIGHSLGATFILKYLTENNLPKTIDQLHLVVPYISNEYAIYIEKLGTFQFDIDSIPTIQNQCADIHIWHSKDDTVVPFDNSEKVSSYLPKAHMHIFEDRGHFNQPAFIELLLEIQK